MFGLLYGLNKTNLCIAFFHHIFNILIFFTFPCLICIHEEQRNVARDLFKCWEAWPKSLIHSRLLKFQVLNIKNMIFPKVTIPPIAPYDPSDKPTRTHRCRSWPLVPKRPCSGCPQWEWWNLIFKLLITVKTLLGPQGALFFNPSGKGCLLVFPLVSSEEWVYWRVGS